MSQPRTVDPGPLGPLAPVGMPPSGLHLLGAASPPTHHGRRLRALVVAMALRGGGEERLGTRLGLVSGGSMAYTKLGHATAVGTQNPGRVCPREPCQHPRNHAREKCKFANRPRARAASRDRSIEQESMMSEEKS